jgi:chromosome partitioning protein
MIITITNLKGGTGKTTTAIGLAHAISKKSKLVFLDMDKQQTGLNWSQSIQNNKWTSFGSPNEITKKELDILTKNNTSVIIDTPPGNLQSIISAIKVADVLVIPVQPTGADISQLEEIINLASQAMMLKKIPVFFLLSRVIKNTIAQKEIRKLLLNESLKVLNTEIFQSQDLAMSYGHELLNIEPYRKIAKEIGVKYDK